MEEMVIFSRTFDLLKWLLPKAEKFPRAYRFSVTQRMMHTLLDFQEFLFDAHSKKGSQRLETLRLADSTLNKIRLYLRLVHEWKWLNNGQYRHVSMMVVEIGRLLGGWIKASDSGR
ncbi:MAG: diversity-generating retroelement protein Avd [Anaerolineales bacterium]|nr:diversity-generating retroelement protein Avd [Anaerolineales bacterium]